MRVDFNSGWQFSKMDGVWKKVDLPHDAMLEGKRSAEAEGKSAAGFFPGGRYTYQKEFEIQLVSL